MCLLFLSTGCWLSYLVQVVAPPQVLKVIVIHSTLYHSHIVSVIVMMVFIVMLCSFSFSSVVPRFIYCSLYFFMFNVVFFLFFLFLLLLSLLLLLFFPLFLPLLLLLNRICFFFFYFPVMIYGCMVLLVLYYI